MRELAGLAEFWTIFTAQEPAGIAITLVIVIAFLVGVTDAWRALEHLRREMANVATGRKQLEALGDRLPSRTSELLKALQLAPTSLVGQRVARVLDLRSAGFGQREVLGRISLEDIGGRGALARFIATILTLLGLIGTVVGMSLAMLRITGAFHNVDNVQALSELTVALSGTLEGMKTAFACTLAGLAAATLLSGLNHVVRRRQSEVVQHLEELITCQLLPAVERVDPDADNSARTFALVLTQSSEQLLALGEKFESAAGRYEGASSRLVETVDALASGTRAAMGDLSEAVRALQGGVNQFATNQETSAKVLPDLRDAVQELVRTTGSELERIEKFSQQTYDVLTKRLAAMDATTKDNQDLVESLVRYETSFKEFVERTSRHLEGAFQAILEHVNRDYQDGVKGHVDRTHKVLEDLLREHTAKLQAFSNLMLEMHVDGRLAHTDGQVAPIG